MERTMRRGTEVPCQQPARNWEPQPTVIWMNHFRSRSCSLRRAFWRLQPQPTSWLESYKQPWAKDTQLRKIQFFISKMRIIWISTSLSYSEVNWLYIYIYMALRIANTWLNCCCSGALHSIILLAHMPVQLCLCRCSVASVMSNCLWPYGP